MSQNDNVTPIRKPPPLSSVHCFIAYFKIAFFKGTPDQVPFNIACLLKAFIIYCAINLWLLDIHSSFASVMGKIAVEMLLLGAFTYLGLKLTKKTPRFLQTMSSLIGIGMIISVTSIPIYYLFIPQFLQQQEINQTVINITVLLLIWNLAVISHIFKRSFEVSTFMAATLSFNYLILFEVIIISFSTGAS